MFRLGWQVAEMGHAGKARDHIEKAKGISFQNIIASHETNILLTGS